MFDGAVETQDAQHEDAALFAQLLPRYLPANEDAYAAELAREVSVDDRIALHKTLGDVVDGGGWCQRLEWEQQVMVAYQWHRRSSGEWAGLVVVVVKTPRQARCLRGLLPGVGAKRIR